MTSQSSHARTRPRTLLALEESPGLHMERLLLDKGSRHCFARLRQRTEGRVPLHTGSDHVLIVELQQFGARERWIAGRSTKWNARQGTVTTTPAFSHDEWRFADADVLQVHVPDAVLREMAAETVKGDPDRVEILALSSARDAAAAHLAHALMAEATIGPLPSLYAETIGLCFAQILLGRYTNLAGHTALPPPSSPTAPRPGDRRLARAVDYIETHLPEPMTVGEIASVGAMSPSHFARSFKSATGEPVWAYVVRRRTERAREMLTRTDLSQAIVAHRCGFSDAGHLRRMLRRQS